MPETISLNAPDQTPFDAYVARPEGDPIGGIVLIHEIWGLVPHIRDVADRFAREGWLVVAPDILSHAGVAPALGEELFGLLDSDDEEKRAAAQPRMREALSAGYAPDYADWAVSALRAAVDWLDGEPGVRGRIGAVGFCFGGSYTFLLAAADGRIRGAVPFYGAAPDRAAIARMQAPVLAIYGQNDPKLMQSLPGLRADMREAGVDFEAVVYPEASHAFFNDTGQRHRPGDAADAWRRTLAFLRTHVAGLADVQPR